MTLRSASRMRRSSSAKRLSSAFRSMSPAQPALYLLAAVSDLLYCLFDSRFGPAGFPLLVENLLFLPPCHARTILIATAHRLLPRIFCHRPPPLASPNA